MKKLISTIVAITMIVAMTIPASALDTDIPTGGNANTPVSATTAYPSATYTVTIPEKVAFGEITKTDSTSIATMPLSVTLKDQNNILERKVIVKISSTFLLTITGGTQTLAYKVYNVPLTGGTELGNNVEFGTFAKADVGTAKTGRVDVDKKDIPAVGDYTGTVTFTISLEAAAVASGS